VKGRKATELASAVWFSRSQRQLKRAAEQLTGELERGVVVLGHPDPPGGRVAAGRSLRAAGGEVSAGS
jgi:hypothetical protein